MFGPDGSAEAAGRGGGGGGGGKKAGGLADKIGMIPRVCHSILAPFALDTTAVSQSVCLSYVEVYQNKVC